MDGIAFCCFTELGQKFSFPVMAAKESNTGSRCQWCISSPP